MTTNKIKLYKQELRDILDTLEKFPEVEQLDLICRNDSGIGYILDISFPYTVNGVDTVQTIEISGVDKW